MTEEYKCPYCEKTFTEEFKMKNHVRQMKGDGHGPYGEYPRDFPQEMQNPIQAREWIPLDAFEDGEQYKQLGYSEINMRTQEMR